MRLTDHVTLNFKMSMVVVFLDIKDAFDVTWHPDYFFFTRIIKLIILFLLNRKFRVSVEGEMSMTWKTQVGIPQGSVLFPSLYSLHRNDTS
jgi:hypothetical protein